MKDIEVKINQDKCSVDKRHLDLNIDILEYNTSSNKTEWNNYKFGHDHWGDKEITILEINGKKSSNFNLLTVYKHCLQAVIDTQDDAKIFIDRRYCHNNSYDVYFNGKHYLVGNEN